MATNLQIIRDALAILGVLSEIEQASAEQGEHGLRILNEVLEEWQADGVAVGQWPQGDINAESPLAQSTLPAIKYALGAALGPYYGLALKPDDVARAERYYSRLVRDAVIAKLEPADMSHLGGQMGRWSDITQG